MRKQILVAVWAMAGILFGLQAAQAEMQTFYDNALQKFVSYDVQAVMARSAQAKGASYSPIPRETVSYDGPYSPGTIIVNTTERRLYLVEDNGKALKYGIGVGREGFTWQGSDRISRKAEWPGWTPPAVMIAREKAKGRILPAYMKGGIGNPLGARALYIGARIYRIHGSNEPWTIGQAVSSGCIRLTNDDIVDLYDRVKVGTKVVVLN
jgi:lipoprotein-anchoring transpeptidase ErfK/SrfK